jgi:hypothetical protein
MVLFGFYRERNAVGRCGDGGMNEWGGGCIIHGLFCFLHSHVLCTLYYYFSSFFSPLGMPRVMIAWSTSTYLAQYL